MKKFRVSSFEVRARPTPRGALRFATRNLQLGTSAAFTLIELLVVMAIITVVVALGIPLFGVLTGAKSVEAGRNVVAATIGAARTVAVNEGKYAGVLFYVDPSTGRTAMSVVVVNVGGNQPATTGLEDPDPYDKYKGWVSGQEYNAPVIDANGVPTRGDRAIGLAVDADATFKGDLYTKAPQPSTYLNFFGNYRPVVRSYRCTEENTASSTNRPPRNGPYGTYTGSAAVPQQFVRLPSRTQSPAPSAESKIGSFANQWWNASLDKEVTRYDSASTGEQTLLPVGIGAQVLVQSISMPSGKASDTEHYLRTALIMFDPQGRLVQQTFALSNTDPLGEYLALSGPAANVASGLGIVLYDEGRFKAVTRGFNPDAGSRAEEDVQMSDADATHQFVNNNASVIASFRISAQAVFNGALDDRKKPVPLGASPAPISAADAVENNRNELIEEYWLDNNTAPLLINRYSGSLSDAQ